LPLCLLLCGPALAQTANVPTAARPASAAQPAAKTPIEQRVERIHLEDKSNTIDELRIGGETKSIEVQPKGDMPAYQVAPDSGERSWKVLGF